MLFSILLFSRTIFGVRKSFEAPKDTRPDTPDSIVSFRLSTRRESYSLKEHCSRKVSCEEAAAFAEALMLIKRALMFF